MTKLLALLALHVRIKKALQKAARAGQSRSEVRPAVTETTCAQWRAGCFNLVVGMGEASGRPVLDLSKIHEKTLKVKNKSFTECQTEGLIMKAN